ncbi:uncharacterized protein LOC141651011 [Silene latifolia]|uniref:uncharacterized protein LOC141651011 n=1 Tax=Silene latifolia TaxID=37657 RepID=UPI003D77E1C3
MSKAYDKVRWDFLEAVLVRYGFPQKLITLMMNCVTSVSYEILVNGIPLPQFRPRCGLRQGDPLSPYLFILCMEVLSRNMEHANEQRLIHGIQLVREVQPITHLFFADDSVFFFKDRGDAVAQIFRQKRFGTQVFLHGMTPIKGSGCSWGVRSILHGLNFVLENIGWKPGTASMINVWTARWVGGDRPEPRNEWLDHSSSHLATLQVQDLFLSGGNWNEVFIKGLFTEEWAARILAIPRCEVRQRDKIYCPHTTTGVYTVKSGYGLIFEDFMNKVGTVKDNSRLNDRGRSFCRTVLWNLPVPQMWKILIWKIVTNVLPIGQEFYKRNIEVDSSCSMCRGDQRAMETSEHLFRDCGLSSRIWAGSDLGIRVEGAGGVPISDWICNWIRYLTKRDEGTREVILFVATLWALWTVRNKIKFQNQFQVDKGIEEGTPQKEALAIRNGRPVCILGIPTGCAVVRVKVDASWNRNYEAAFGWIASDDTWRELGRRQERIRAESALQAEALGIRDIVMWAQERRVLHLDISSDCLQLITQLAGADKDDHRITGTLEDIQASFSFFHCLVFNFILSRFNGFVHNLAKQAMNL